MRLTTAILGVLLAAALSACASAPFGNAGAGDRLLGVGGGVDHILIWSRDRDAATAVLRDRLGFTVRDGGQFPDGVSNRLVLFSDQSYLELLFIDDMATARVQTPDDVKFLEMTYGPSHFGLETSRLDGARDLTIAAGLPASEPDSMAYDPDGPEGPKPAEPGPWRTMDFGKGNVPGEPFLIQYAPSADEPGSLERRRQAAIHPNGAVRLSAVWVAVNDLRAAGRTYARLGLTRQRPVALPHLNGRGLAIRTNDSWILLVEPKGPGRAQDALAWVGHRVFGVSIEVADLNTARTVLQRGGIAPEAFHGPFGPALMPPSRQELGLFFEFHTPR